MNTESAAPSTSKEFDKVYNSAFAHWVWSDIRIPTELKELVATHQPKTSLELGCGLGRFSSYMANEGIEATGVDFSEIAIKKANERIENDTSKPTLMVGDVTQLSMLSDTFDVIFDVGCFHCLNEEAQQKYLNEAHRLLNTNGVLLIWALDSSPIGIKLNSEYMTEVIGNRFVIEKSIFSRRRIVASHWYWLRKIS
jgi:cyclopropane fatty-acyl-phospholipid synthase-like methyltransferase